MFFDISWSLRGFVLFFLWGGGGREAGWGGEQEGGRREGQASPTLSCVPTCTQPPRKEGKRSALGVTVRAWWFWTKSLRCSDFTSLLAMINDHVEASFPITRTESWGPSSSHFCHPEMESTSPLPRARCAFIKALWLDCLFAELFAKTDHQMDGQMTDWWMA